VLDQAKGKKVSKFRNRKSRIGFTVLEQEE
jgi:hypothetical protein